MRVLDDLLKAVRDAAVFNPYDQMPPWFTQWPDGSRLLEAAE